MELEKLFKFNIYYYINHFNFGAIKNLFLVIL